MDKVSTPGTGHGRKWSDIRRGFSPSRGMSDRTKKEGVEEEEKRGGKKEKEHNNLFFDL